MPSKPPQPGVLYKRHQDCPDRAKHTRHPEGYIAHGEWAMQKMKTHRCEQCPTCGFWSIWVPKKSARIDGTGCGPAGSTAPADPHDGVDSA